MIYPIRTIVAGVAHLEGEDPVLAAAAELAGRTGAALHFVHAFELPGLMWDAYARMGYADAHLLDTYTRSVQARLEARVREAAPGARVRCHAVAGPAAGAIQEVARRESADLILVGATRHGALARALLGTTAQRVLRGAPAPVLVLRGPLTARAGRVLLTSDLSPFSAGIHEAGLDVLESLFDGDPAELRSLLVVWYELELPPPLTGGVVEDVALQRLAEFLRKRRTRSANVEGRVRVGDAAEQIVAEAAEWGADLVVLGTHGRTGARRWLLGSVAESAVRSLGANVLVIPPRVEEQWSLSTPVEPEAPGAEALPI